MPVVQITKYIGRQSHVVRARGDHAPEHPAPAPGVRRREAGWGAPRDRRPPAGRRQSVLGRHFRSQPGSRHLRHLRAASANHRRFLLEGIDAGGAKTPRRSRSMRFGAAAGALPAGGTRCRRGEAGSVPHSSPSTARPREIGRVVPSGRTLRSPPRHRRVTLDGDGDGDGERRRGAAPARAWSADRDACTPRRLGHLRRAATTGCYRSASARARATSPGVRPSTGMSSSSIRCSTIAS